MKIIASSNYYAQQYPIKDPKQQIGFKGSDYTEYRVQLYVNNLNKIFMTPIEERSHHLIHEYNPTNKKPILSKFKLIAKDGAKITVIRSVSKNQEPPFPYIKVTVEKDGTQKTLRLNPENRRIIKSGLDKESLYCERIKHYQIEEINSIPTIKEVLDYIPEITKFINNIPKPTLEKAKIKKTVSEADIEKIIEQAELATKGVDFDGSKTTSNVTKIMPNSATILAQHNKIKITQNIQKDDGTYQIENNEKISQIIDIYDDIRDYIDSLTTHLRKKALATDFKDIFARFSGSQALMVKNLSDNQRAKILNYPYQDILRITIYDKNDNLIRGYMIKDEEKIIKNYNLAHPTSIPTAIKIASNEDLTNEYKTKLNKDITEISEKMKEAKAILDKIHNKNLNSEKDSICNDYDEMIPSF